MHTVYGQNGDNKCCNLKKKKKKCDNWYDRQVRFLKNVSTNIKQLLSEIQNEYDCFSSMVKVLQKISL